MGIQGIALQPTQNHTGAGLLSQGVPHRGSNGPIGPEFILMKCKMFARNT
jgi:hypothetical protein